MIRLEGKVATLSVTFEFDTQAELVAAIEKLRMKHEVTGEFHVQPVAGRGWRLKLSSEKPLRESILERLSGRRVDSTP